MHTTFIAVQCFRCSTMQVKQQKKSCNKWSCVVCNEKQSVRTVFAQGFMAKDVRKFVQNFNMSRQLSDQKQLLQDEIETFDSPSNEPKQKPKRRNDWTEYVNDDQEEHFGKFDKDENHTEGDSGFEPMVVTEIPKALFKKPKLKDYSSHGHGPEKLIKPLFSHRSNSKKHQKDHSQDAQLTEFEQTSCERAPKRSFQTRAFDVCPNEEAIGLHSSDRASKWNSFRAQIQDHNTISANKEKKFVRQPRKEVMGSISKWSGYIAQDDDKHANEAPIEQQNQTRTSKGPVSKWSSFLTEEKEDEDDDELVRVDQPRYDLLEPLMNVERVEDDIHPDFL